MNIRIEKEEFSTLFGGMGFHNNEALMYPLMEKEHFNQVICKTYREISPSFMRAFAGFSDWSKTSMDSFAAYYEMMQKWTDTPMYFTPGRGKLHFSREEKVKYAEDVAENLDYLINTKGVKHLRYYCFSNEMSQIKWGHLLNDLELFKEYHELLYQAFQNKKLNIGLLATDAAPIENWKSVDWALENMPQITTAYCVHHYEQEYDIHEFEFYEWFYNKCLEISQKAMKQDEKRVILGEYGIKTKEENQLIAGRADICQYFFDERASYSCLMLCEMAIAAMNGGIYALALWSFCDYPDPHCCGYSNEGYDRKWGESERYLGWGTDVRYNKWGMTKWESNGDYTARESYWSIGLLSKFFKKGSWILRVENEDEKLRIGAIQNRDNSVSIAIINRNEQLTDTVISLGISPEKTFRRYEYDSNNVPYNKFADLQNHTDCMNPENGNISITLLPQSLTILTTDYIVKDKEVVAEGLELGLSTLSWDAVKDRNHCYYRVYCGDSNDFEACESNQLASTVATELEIGINNRKYYKVYSVDKSGNCFING